MNHNIKFLSRNNIPIYSADNWYPWFFEKQFKEYGRDDRRHFNTPEHIKGIIEATNIFAESYSLQQSEKLAVDTAIIFMDSILHQADLSAEQLFKTCYQESRFAFGFYMQPFPPETLVTACQLVRARKYNLKDSKCRVLNGIISDSSRFWLSKDLQLVKNKLQQNIVERSKVRETYVNTEYELSIKYLKNLLEDGNLFETSNGKKIEPKALGNIKQLLEMDFDVSTATFR